MSAQITTFPKQVSLNFPVLYIPQLIHQRSFLRDERRLIRTSTDHLEATKASIAGVQKAEWLDPAIVKGVNVTKRVQLSVGGVVSMLHELTPLWLNSV